MTNKTSLSFLFFLASLLPIISIADDGVRTEWVLNENYDGSHQTSFNKLRYEVPILIRQRLIDMSVRCGLNFNEGWLIPLTVQFVEESPGSVENMLAYVQLEQNRKGDLRQSLNVNLTAYDQDKFDFDRVFAHELVHAMVNDSLGAGSAKLPVWFHEGLAVYGANQGEQMMQSYVSRNPNASESMFLNGLEGPHNGLDYMEDYLAFKYIHDRHGVNSLQGFIREVTRNNKPIPQAIEETCFESWDKFQENSRKFAENEIFQTSRSLRGSERQVKPY